MFFCSAARRRMCGRWDASSTKCAPLSAHSRLRIRSQNSPLFFPIFATWPICSTLKPFLTPLLTRLFTRFVFFDAKFLRPGGADAENPARKIRRPDHLGAALLAGADRNRAGDSHFCSLLCGRFYFFLRCSINRDAC